MKVMLVGGKGRHNDRFVANLHEMGVEVIRRWDANSKKMEIAAGAEAVLVMHDHMSHNQYATIKKMAASAGLGLVHVSKKMALTKRVLQEVLGMGFKDKDKPVELKRKKDGRGGHFKKRHWKMQEILLILGLRNRGWSWRKIGGAVGASETSTRVAFKNSEVNKAIVEGHFKVDGVFSGAADLSEKSEKAASAYLEANKEVVHPENLPEADTSVEEQRRFWENLASDLESEVNDLKAELQKAKQYNAQLLETHRQELDELREADQGVKIGLPLAKDAEKQAYLSGLKVAISFAKKGLTDELIDLLDAIG